LRNSADALPPSNTRPTWKSYKVYPPLFFLLLAFTLLSQPLSGAAGVEAQACAEALDRPVAAPRSALPARLEVMVWNIEKAQDANWNTDLAALGANSDLILVQEAVEQAGIGAALPRHLYRSFAAGYINGTQQTGVLTLSSAAPTLHCNLTAWEPWLGTPKATNITEYPIQGADGRLLVINVHAVNFTVGLEDFETQLRALEPLLANHAGPLIVAGDFNTWSEDRTQFLLAFMRDHRLSPVPFRPDLRTRFWEQPLDHVYLRDLTLIAARAVVVNSSDHNPLLITVET